MQSQHVFAFCVAVVAMSASVVAWSSLAPPPSQGAAARVPASEIDAVLAFWREAGPRLWFAKEPAFDARFRERFLAAHEAAARGELDAWRVSAEGALALVILLDQFPRNAFRDTPRMYATDRLAREVANEAIAAQQDIGIPRDLLLFLYLPFGHSEDPADQERSVELARRYLTPIDRQHAEHHRDIIRRFGRFPHRNAVLGRATTPEEQEYLDAGGFRG